jgi:hypothetical protein
MQANTNPIKFLQFCCATLSNAAYAFRCAFQACRKQGFIGLRVKKLCFLPPRSVIGVKPTPFSLSSLAKTSEIFLGWYNTNPRLAWIFFGAIMALSVWQNARMPLHMDCNWILTVAKRMIEDQQLYGAAGVDINPPLIFHLMQLPVLLSQTLDVSYKTGFLLFVYAVAGISLTTAYSLLPQYQGRAKAFVFGILMYGVLVFCGYQFGQREHLLFLFALPYLLLAVQRLDGIEVSPLKRILFSIVAAIGFCLKPHIFLLPAVLECFLAYRTRQFSKLFSFETISMAIVIIGYGAFTALVYPDYINFHARTLTELYAGFGSLEKFLENPQLVYMILISVLLLLCIHSAKPLFAVATPQQKNLLSISLISACVFYIGAAMQCRFYAYHLIPAFVMVLFCFAQGMVLTHFKNKIHSICLVSGILIGLVYYQNIVYAVFYPQYAEKSLVSLELQELDPTAKSATVMVGGLNPQFPFRIESDLIWASRFPGFYLIDGLSTPARVARLDPAFQKQITEYVTSAVIEDLQHYQPDLVVVVKATKVDYLAFLKQSAVFAEMWSNYSLLQETQEHIIYKRMHKL